MSLVINNDKLWLKGGALLYVVGLSVVIGIITTSIVIIGAHHRLELEQLLLQKKLVDNANSGMEYLLSGQADEVLIEQSYDLFGKGQDSVILTQVPWGLFQLKVVKAFNKGRLYTKAAITGSDLPDHIPSFYLTDRGKPLSIVGSTKIGGKALLPKAGYKRAYVEGRTSMSTNAMTGDIGISGNALPEIELAPSVLSIGYSRFSTMVLDGNVLDSHIAVSFGDSILVIEGVGDFTISSGAQLKGAIVLHTSGKVTVERGASIEDIVVIASTVIVKDGFEGVLHIEASDNVYIGEKAQLQYPSTIYLTDKLSRAKGVYLASNSTVSGAVIVKGNADALLLKMEKGADIYGLTYVTGRVAIQGDIHGSLMCNSTYLRSPSSVYDNYLIDATINHPFPHKAFVHIPVSGTSSSSKIVKWLH